MIGRRTASLPKLITFLEHAADQIAMALAQRQAQAALRRASNRYRSLFENMLNGFAYCRMLFDQDRPQDFIYLDVNDAFETLTGLKNVVGKRVSEVIPGIRESDPGVIEIYGRVALTGVPERFETYVNALGMWFAVSVYSPAKEHFVAVFDVITERKQAELALRESEERYRSIFQGSPTPLREEDYSEVKKFVDQLRTAGVTDFREYFNSHPQLVRSARRRSKILDVNRAALDLHQATSKDELLAGLHVIFTDESYDSFREVLIAIADGTTILNRDVTVRTLHGDKRHIQLRWAVSSGSEETLGQSVRIAGRHHADRKRLQEEVALREQQLNSFFRGATAGLALLDKDLRYIQINATLAEMNGISVEQHIGKTVREIVPRLAPAVEPILQKVLTTGEPVLNVEVIGETCARRTSSGTGWSRSSRRRERTGGRMLSARSWWKLPSENAQAALRESEARFRQAIETSPDAIMVLDLDAHILLANQQAASLMGFETWMRCLPMREAFLICSRPKTMGMPATTLAN